jgi:hypothetical protein
MAKLVVDLDDGDCVPKFVLAALHVMSKENAAPS